MSDTDKIRESIAAIDAISRLTSDERHDLIRRYAKMGEVERLLVHKEQARLLRIEKRKGRGDIMAYATLVKALFRSQYIEQAAANDAAKAIRLDSQIHAKRLLAIAPRKRGRPEGKQAKKYRERYHDLTHHLLTQKDFSFTGAAAYLKRYHKFRVTPTYLATMYRRRLEVVETLVDDK